MPSDDNIPTAIGRRSDFEVIKFLSAAEEGGFNVGIYIVKEHRTRVKYIEKRLHGTDIRRRQAHREVRAMLQLQNHKNIIQIKAYDLNYQSLGYGSLFMQYCELGSLADVIKAHRARLVYSLADEGFLWKVFWDMSLALCHLCTGRSSATTRRRAKEGKSVDTLDGWNHIIHRDIKPDNLFLTWNAMRDGSICHYPNVVLGDFGLCTSSADIDSGRASAYMHNEGTPGFAPPEAPQFRVRGDTYQLALTIQCLAGMLDRPDNGAHVLPRVYRCRYLKNLLIDCLRTNPENRPMPHDLPKLVHRGWMAWRNSRRDDGKRLPTWVFT
jgi:serine/threonine protein kinase